MSGSPVLQLFQSFKVYSHECLFIVVFVIASQFRVSMLGLFIFDFFYSPVLLFALFPD